MYKSLSNYVVTKIYPDDSAKYFLPINQTLQMCYLLGNGGIKNVVCFGAWQTSLRFERFLQCKKEMVTNHVLETKIRAYISKIYIWKLALTNTIYFAKEKRHWVRKSKEIRGWRENGRDEKEEGTSMIACETAYRKFCKIMMCHFLFGWCKKVELITSDFNIYSLYIWLDGSQMEIVDGNFCMELIGCYYNLHAWESSSHIIWVI